MKTDLYIPKTITIGSQQRSGTFTGKLGYVIYTDHKGKLRKEASWNRWRDRKIDPITIDNTAQTGFTLNKGVQRDGYWGSGRSVIRVWDPRDFEFEISVDNLIGILMHADVSKRDITEPCVFAWHGTELILLPTNSVEYQESVKHTEKQGMKFSARSLIVGHTYSVKQDHTKVVYLGYLDRYEMESIYSEATLYRSRTTSGCKQIKKNKKAHVFMDPITKYVTVKDPSAYIAGVEMEEMSPVFAELMESYYKHIESQPIVGLTLVPLTTPDISSNRQRWFKLSNGEFVLLQIDHNGKITPSHVYRWDGDTSSVVITYPDDTRSSYPRSYYNRPHFSTTTSSLVREAILTIQPVCVALISNSDYNTWSWQERNVKINETLAQHNIGTLHYTFANGKQSNRTL